MKGDSNEAKTKPGETWIRIITQGQEVTIDCDEKTLADMGFKDNQVKQSLYSTLYKKINIFGLY